MALPTQMLLCITVQLVLMAIPGSTGSYISLCLTDQLDISTPVFRANLMSILDAVPAAAAPTGFATLRFGLEPTPAIVRGLCFADDPSPQQCLGCLQSTVAEMKAKNCTHTWFAGIWGDDCFLAYSHINSSTVFEEKFRRLNFTVGDGIAYPKFFEIDELGELAQSLVTSNDATTYELRSHREHDYSGEKQRARALAHCARDRESNCARCVRDSAMYLEECPILNGDFECQYLESSTAPMRVWPRCSASTATYGSRYRRPLHRTREKDKA